MPAAAYCRLLEASELAGEGRLCLFSPFLIVFAALKTRQAAVTLR